MCLKKKYISLAIRTVTEWHSRPSIQLSNLMTQLTNMVLHYLRRQLIVNDLTNLLKGICMEGIASSTNG